MFGTSIKRDAKVSFYNFTDYFRGFEGVPAIQELFGDNTERVLSDLKVEFYSSTRGYMSVNDEDGHILVSAHYLKHGSEREIYLDIIHELVHVKQFQNGLELFEHRWEYVDRPTEIEAYTHVVKEARRIGMTDEEIYKYLDADWMDEEDLNRLARTVEINIPARVK